MNSYRQDKSYYAVGIRHTRPRAKPTLYARVGIVTKVKRFAFGKIRIFWWGQLPGAELW